MPVEMNAPVQDLLTSLRQRFPKPVYAAPEKASNGSGLVEGATAKFNTFEEADVHIAMYFTRHAQISNLIVFIEYWAAFATTWCCAFFDLSMLRFLRRGVPSSLQHLCNRFVAVALS